MAETVTTTVTVAPKFPAIRGDSAVVQSAFLQRLATAGGSYGMTQNPAAFTGHEGSTPSSSTIMNV